MILHFGGQNIILVPGLFVRTEILLQLVSAALIQKPVSFIGGSTVRTIRVVAIA